LRGEWVLVCLALLSVAPLPGQQPEPTPPPAGQVILAEPTEVTVPTDQRPAIPVTDDERSAVEITSLALDLHLIPADAREEGHATIQLHNRSAEPILRIPLQLSSSLHWTSAAAATPAGLRPIPFTQSPISTDADHTAYAQEAVFTPAELLAPGASLTLSVVYSGEIQQNSDRLELLGTPKDRAQATDWDQIAPTSDAGATALRGFGNVLWYPCAAPSALFGNGNQLFDLIARERLRNTAVSMRLRLTVEYVGDPPEAAIFNGQLQPLTKVPDVNDQLVEETHGTATADFPLAPIGFRTPNLFLTAQSAVTTGDQMLTIVTPRGGAVEPYAAAARSLQPVFAELLGPTPRASLLLLDHAGEPFQDEGFLVAQLSSEAEPKLVAPDLVSGVAHAWFSPQSRAIPSSSLWLDEGLAEYMSLVWTERTQGKDAVNGELRHAATLVALAEGATAQPLTQAYADPFLRLKSAFVLWQLREILGDELFSESLTAFRHSLALNPMLDRDENAFETSIEKTSKRDLGWFFADWVYADKSLPDLTIVQSSSHPLPAKGGKSAGYIVAVEVRNDGDAVADVPVTLRAGNVSATERVRVPAHGSASTRVVFEGAPETLEVNDGSVPELRASSHTLQLPPPD
jgi:hypothetical protein